MCLVSLANTLLLIILHLKIESIAQWTLVITSTDIANVHYNNVILAVPNLRFPLYCIVFVTLIIQGFVITSKFLWSQGTHYKESPLYAFAGFHTYYYYYFFFVFFVAQGYYRDDHFWGGKRARSSDLGALCFEQGCESSDFNLISDFCTLHKTPFSDFYCIEKHILSVISDYFRPFQTFSHRRSHTPVITVLNCTLLC